MKLLPLDSPAVVGIAADWLARTENAQWLDFGNGRQGVTPALLKIMAQRETHFIRVYARDGVALGIVGLNGVDRVAGTGTLWAVAGDKSFANRGYVSLATSKFLTLAFRELGLRSVNTWIVDSNPSLRSLRRLGFRYVGRLRQCHMIDGRLHDRLLFDLLAAEHEELGEERWRRLERSRREPVW